MSGDGVIAVLRWAAGGRESAPPPVDPRTLDAIRRPAPALRGAIGELASLTAARLRLGAPPLGDETPLSCDVAVVAAALGLTSIPRLSLALLSQLSPPKAFADWTVYHGLIGRALPVTAESIRDDLRRISPLTAILDFPAPGHEGDAMSDAARLVAVPAGRRALLTAFATPSPSPAVRNWRAGLMSAWRDASEDAFLFVLDVYEAAMIHHERAFLDQVRAARAVITAPSATDVEANEALSIANWWEPLARIDQASPAKLRERRYLGYDYREGLKLQRLTRRMTGVIP